MTLGKTVDLVAGSGGWNDTPSLSADGRYLAFESSDEALGHGFNYMIQVYVRDRVAGTTTKVSVPDNGAQPDGSSVSPSISDDGRFVAFETFRQTCAAAAARTRT